MVDVEPRCISRVLLLFPKIGKGKKFGRAVVENSVDDDAESSTMGLLDEFEKLFVGRTPLPTFRIGGFPCG